MSPMLTMAERRAEARSWLKDACGGCGAVGALCVHHINKDTSDNRPENLLTFCRSCHTRWHWEHDPDFRLIGKRFPVPAGLLTKRNVATMFKLSTQTVDNLRRRDDDPLPALKFGAQVRFVEGDVELWAERQADCV